MINSDSNNFIFYLKTLLVCLLQLAYTTGAITMIYAFRFMGLLDVPIFIVAAGLFFVLGNAGLNYLGYCDKDNKPVEEPETAEKEN